MTRLLCVGDLHIGAGPDYGREPGDRLRDQEQAWTQILDIARDCHVDAVLFAGDAFHRRRPTPAEYLAFLRPLQAFNAETEIPVLAINGNHDVEASDLPSALELFERELTLSRRPGTYLTAYGVTVVTLPWAPTGRVIAQLGGGDRDNLNATAAELLVQAARDLRDSVEGQCVLMLHWSVSGASTPTGVLTDDFHEVVLDADQLAGLGFDAVVCGHIHKAQTFTSVLGWQPAIAPLDAVAVDPFFYTGSPLPVDFGEASTRHGVWLLDINEPVRPHAVHADFLPIGSRPFVTVDVDLTAEAADRLDLDETDAVAAAIATHMPLVDAVVRVRYRATEKQAQRVDRHALTGLLVDAGVHKVWSLGPSEIVRTNRARVEHVDDDVTPAAAVDMWCDAHDIDDHGRTTLSELSARYLQEVNS